MKSVGLITMHRVDNCGSFLQAYATVKAVEKAGFDCTVIDYLYPTSYHLKNAQGNENLLHGRFRKVKKLLRVVGMLDWVRGFLAGRRLRRAARKFSSFAGVKMTRPYTRIGIAKNPPLFDLYLTGSDQTWNPRYIADDHTFLLDFLSDSAKRVSYAASFGCRELPSAVSAEYARCLLKYSAISVRETSGVDIVRSLTGREAVDVADPTFLLSADEWRAKAAVGVVPAGRFIFAYLLSYVFDPYPEVVHLLRDLSSVLKAHVVVYADGNVRHELEDSGFTVLRPFGRGLSPEAFLAYVDRSVFVVTTSFHGTAFAVNFRKDFYALINPNTTKDDRVKSFLAKVGLDARGILPKTAPEERPPVRTSYVEAEQMILDLKSRSSDFLSKALKEAAR